MIWMSTAATPGLCGIAATRFPIDSQSMSRHTPAHRVNDAIVAAMAGEGE